MIRRRRLVVRRSVLFLTSLLLVWCSTSAAGDDQAETQVIQVGSPLTETRVLPEGLFQWELRRHDESVLTFYSTFERLERDLPLAVWMQGSGSSSLFTIENGRARSRVLSLISTLLGPEVQLLAVEKRGVEFGENVNGGALGASREYHEFATLEDRSADVVRVLETFRDQNILPKNVLAIGHSEGADVAAKVAADDPGVTHLAFLSGGGPSQLVDLMTLIRKGAGSPEEKEAEIDALWDQWHAIRADPRSADTMWLGHAYRRWSSYFNHPPVESLLKTNAKILIIQGSADDAVPIESADLCAVELSRAGRDFEYLRLPGADHSLRTPQQVSDSRQPFLSLGQILHRFFLGS